MGGAGLLLSVRILVAMLAKEYSRHKEYFRNYRKNHRDQQAVRAKEWRIKNPNWRREYYAKHRSRILESNRRSAERHRGFWKRSQGGRHKRAHRLLRCAECGQEVVASTATSYPHMSKGKRKFALCAECESTRPFLCKDCGGLLKMLPRQYFIDRPHQARPISTWCPSCQTLTIDGPPSLYIFWYDECLRPH